MSQTAVKCYVYTWDELLAAAERRECVTDLQGHILCSRDRVFETRKARDYYQVSVAQAIARGLDVPDAVRAEYEQRIMANGLGPDHARFAAWAPAGMTKEDFLKQDKVVSLCDKRLTQTDTRPKNAKGKPFSWSPSAVSDYINCPAQYAARRFYETLPYVETVQMKHGTTEHKHLELRLRDKTPLPEGFTRGEKYCRAFEQATADGLLIAEQELALTTDLASVGWFDKQAWGRCKIDVTTVKGAKVGCYDWKTGNIREDSLQLKINACFLSLQHPDAKEFVAKYIWLKHDTVTPRDGVFSKAQIPELWEEILGWVRQMEQAWRTETFQPRPSGLCKDWCAVTACPHCGKRAR